jgi:NAD(P)-dependent dehydrogenase (short-subunit alcohol dehydrogenase family)
MSERETSPGSESLAGKRIVVSGSSHGIGRAVALRLGREGARVVVNGSGLGPGGREASQRTLEALALEIEAAGGEAATCVGSVAEEAQAAALIETAISKFGGLDGLVNCAGIPEPANGSSILEISGRAWREVVGVHLDGTFYCCRHAVPQLMTAGGGAIVNTSSHGYLGVYGGTAYAASKGATNSLTWALAADLREQGVRVNAICPGAKTRIASGAGYEAKIAELEARGVLDADLARHSLNAPPPEGCAALYAFLCSDAAQAITGEIFSATGPYVGVFPKPEERFLAYRSSPEVSEGEDQGVGSASSGVWELEELTAALAGKLESR